MELPQRSLRDLEVPCRTRDGVLEGADVVLKPRRCPPGMPVAEGGLGDAQLPGKLSYGQRFVLPEFPDVLC